MNGTRARTLARVAALALGGGVLGTGCSGGGGGGGGDGAGEGDPGDGGDGGGTGVALDGAAAVDPRYVSTIDSSATANAVAAGLDPRFEFLSATFDCHDEADTDLSAPDLQVAFSGDGRYAAPGGEGRVTVADDEVEPDAYRQFRGGPFDGERTYLGFDEFGQRFALDANGAEYRCYQQGASAARAQLLAYLATPRPGDYRCRTPDGSSATLALGADGAYAVDGEIGSWTLGDVVGNESGRVAFAGGTLDGESARYAEEAGNGYRSFDVSTSRSFGPLGLAGGSSELSLTCESFGEPVVMPLYGPAPAPVLPVPPGGGARPAGFWWYDDILISVNDSHAEVRHLLLRSDGYAYAGTPTEAGVDCSRTSPNGLPFCDAYAIGDDGALRLYRPYGEADELAVTFAGGGAGGTVGGTLATIEGETARPVRAVDPARLVGEHENLDYFQSGCTGLGHCSYGLTTRNLGLAGNGRFFFSRTSDGGSSFDGGAYGGPSTYAVGSSSASNVGSWSVTGNVLTLAYDSGRGVRLFVVEDGGTIGVGDLMY